MHKILLSMIKIEKKSWKNEKIYFFLKKLVRTKVHTRKIVDKDLIKYYLIALN